MNDLVDFAYWLGDIAMWSLFWFMVLKALDIFLALRKQSAEAETVKEELSERMEVILHNVKEELHDGIHYWFDEDNDEFLAQGAKLSDVREHLRARFKDHIFIVKDKFVFVGPDYNGQEMANEDEITRFVAKHMLERVGIQVDNK